MTQRKEFWGQYHRRFFLPMNTFQSYLGKKDTTVYLLVEMVVDILGSLVLFSLVNEDFPSLWTLDSYYFVQETKL